MIANALGFRESLRDILKITGGTLGQSQFWNWILGKGADIICISKNNYQDWPNIKLDWVREFMTTRANGTENYSTVLNHENFEFLQHSPNEEELRALFANDYVVEIMGDGWLMYGDQPEAQLLHRVIITNIIDDNVFFHDPAFDGAANYKTSMKNIMSALSVDGAEVVGYKKTQSEK
jgi:hypothetical protein